jgi:predicted TPR repeat methyltransferase
LHDHQGQSDFSFLITMSSISSNNIEHLFEKACELHSESRFADAENIYLSLLELQPDSSLLHYNLGLLYYETEDYKKAFAHYSTARNLVSNDPDLLFNYSLCLKKLGKLHDAVSSFIEFTSTYPDEVDGFYNLGNCYREMKEFEKALKAYEQGLKIDPNHLSINKNMAYVYHLLGHTDNALILYRHVLNFEPGEKQAAHMIAAITGDHGVQAPTEYIREIFDDYSATFEIDLVEDLKYAVPAKLRSELDALDYPSKLFSRCIDLGCGTGLAGIEFNDRCEHLTGIDISGKMIEKAKFKEIYTILEVAEIVSFLKEQRDEYDLIIAADVLTYVGDLVPIFEAVTPAATRHALFCFSTETSAYSDFHLCTTGRFAHSQQYVAETANRYGWKCLKMVETNLRKEKADWVRGNLYFMVKRSIEGSDG